MPWCGETRTEVSAPVATVFRCHSLTYPRHRPGCAVVALMPHSLGCVFGVVGKGGLWLQSRFPGPQGLREVSALRPSLLRTPVQGFGSSPGAELMDGALHCSPLLCSVNLGTITHELGWPCLDSLASQAFACPDMRGSSSSEAQGSVSTLQRDRLEDRACMVRDSKALSALPAALEIRPSLQF